MCLKSAWHDTRFGDSMMYWLRRPPNRRPPNMSAALGVTRQAVLSNAVCFSKLCRVQEGRLDHSRYGCFWRVASSSELLTPCRYCTGHARCRRICTHNRAQQCSSCPRAYTCIVVHCLNELIRATHLCTGQRNQNVVETAQTSSSCPAGEELQ